MNTPNKLTVLRMILTPFFLAVLVFRFPWHFLVAAALFGIAAFTDMADGRIARKQNIITNFGKLLDPVADKMLTTAALLAFVYFGWCHYLVVAIVLLREYLVTALRIVASNQGVVIPANKWGKTKTLFQMIASAVIMVTAQAQETFRLFDYFGPLTHALFSQILMWIAALLTVISGVIYLRDSRALLQNPQGKKAFSAIVYDLVVFNVLIAGSVCFFLKWEYLSIWIVMLLLTLEFGVESLQLIGAAQGVKLPLKSWNNAKTLTVFCLLVVFAVILLDVGTQAFAGLSVPVISLAANVLLGVATLVSLLSAVRVLQYARKTIDFST